VSEWAQFWAVDLHVHTPGSSDARAEDYGTAEDVVSAAIAAGLDAIAITDHNTTTWCEAVAKAAAGRPLVVLPGVEISTDEGHLLAIFEEGTACSTIDDVLARLDIGRADQGKLDIAASVGFAEAAKEIVKAGGVAIAAHIDREKGLLRIPVPATLTRTLLEPCLSALEVVDLGIRTDVGNKIGSRRSIAYVQGSDTWDAAISRHSIAGIGARRTWIKASRPDLVGLKHALGDPQLRVQLGAPPPAVGYPMIEYIELIGGFLDRQSLALCPDLNCLLGGTGAGKSLILEAIRYALDQQVDRQAFPAIHAEVYARLRNALGAGIAKVEFRSGDVRYRVERAFSGDDDAAPRVWQHTGDDWIGIDTAPQELIKLAAFSQGEVLEYSRQPVGRMSLVDAGVDLSEVQSRIADTEGRLRDNATELLVARARVESLRASSAKEPELAEQVRELAALFDTKVVKAQAGWTKDASTLTKARTAVDQLAVHSLACPDATVAGEIAANEDLFTQTADVVRELGDEIRAAEQGMSSAINTARTRLASIHNQWQQRKAVFATELDAELAKVSQGSSLTTLRTHLESLQTKHGAAKASKDELDNEALPNLQQLDQQREELIDRLHRARGERREIRRGRVAELNGKTAGFVKLNVPAEGDFADFRAALGTLKVGSRVRDDVLDAIARYTYPFRFARLMWHGNINELADDSLGIDSASVARLVANIADRDLWGELLELQLVDRPDVLTMRFRKPDDGQYVAIEDLAHGQRCTAILVTLLADGTTPVLVDQPEDALHAPWIEEYLVDRLRSLRGTRQYIFATRSPGIVVSADAEQIITMRATAGRGECEASGSLERHNLNQLALHHLEGGRVPFQRRSDKLQPSIVDEE